MKDLLKLLVPIFIVLNTYSQEIRMPLTKGTVNFCSSMNLKISGYDGNEVIIINKSKYSREEMVERFENDTSAFAKDLKMKRGNSLKKENLKSLIKNKKTERKVEFSIFKIGNGLAFVDSYYDNKVVSFKQDYEILIPNSLTLQLNSNNCTNYDLGPVVAEWTITDFNGETEISMIYGSVKLENVTGPVIVNTVFGNITANFTDIAPSELYSLITNKGDIKISLPSDISNVLINTSSKDILTNIEFNIIENENLGEKTKTKLMLKQGLVNFYLESEEGNISLLKNNLQD